MIRPRSCWVARPDASRLRARLVAAVLSTRPAPVASPLRAEQLLRELEVQPLRRVDHEAERQFQEKIQINFQIQNSNFSLSSLFSILLFFSILL